MVTKKNMLERIIKDNKRGIKPKINSIYWQDPYFDFDFDVLLDIHRDKALELLEKKKELEFRKNRRKQKRKE